MKKLIFILPAILFVITQMVIQYFFGIYTSMVYGLIGGFIVGYNLKSIYDKNIFLRLYYKIFKRYVILETRVVFWDEADKMIKESIGKPEREQWVLAKEEDYRYEIGRVHICRRIRIME